MTKLNIAITCIGLLTACSQAVPKQTDNTDTTAIQPAAVLPKKSVRYGMVTGLKPERVAYYKELHAAVWPGVLKKITDCNIRNYSIYLKEIDGKPYLFSYWEYTGNDFAEDMKKMAADTTTQRWWKETAPAQLPLPDAAAKGETWSRMEEVFHEN
jgi:L-rhamnose mutarotase